LITLTSSPPLIEIARKHISQLSGRSDA